MALKFHDRYIESIGIVGSGNIGPDIALFLATKLHVFKISVNVVDISHQALQNGKAKIETKLRKLQDRGKLNPETVESICSSVVFDDDYNRLNQADIVIEAASENIQLKRDIFSRIEQVISSESIIASNSSHLEPDEIFCRLSHPERALCTHFFFPAERNPALEIISGSYTAQSATFFTLRFFEWLGKFPFKVSSRYGYAVVPIFEGLLLACLQLYEKGLAQIKDLDAICAETLGFSIGPFTAHNLTNGNPITAHGLQELHARINSWFRVPATLTGMLESNNIWEVPEKGYIPNVTAVERRKIQEELLGAYFSLIGNVLDSGIISVSDLDLLMTSALNVKSPFRLMNLMGLNHCVELVKKFHERYPQMSESEKLKDQAASGESFETEVVTFEKQGDVAVLTIRRPKALNALNSQVFKELGQYCDKIQNDPEIKAVVLTGFGDKAFVAGADIKEMAGLTMPSQGEEFARKGQIASSRLEELGKPVVAALNGLAFGGGCELAMCCVARIAPKGLKMLAGQPEVNLGLIPGMGGTQRLPRLVGFEKAAEMIRNANPISSEQAFEYGLVNELVEGDVLPRAIELARDLASGKANVPLIEKGPLSNAPDRLPDIDIGHHSRAIDRLAVQAILEGGKMTLDDGLKNEARVFGLCWTTEDNKIGLKTFVEKGARAKAEFIHK